MTRCIFGPGLAAAISMVALTACGSAEVVIIAALGDGADPDASPLDALEVQLLPYDRDQIFDSLATVAARPEPEIPADLLAAQEEITQARREWRGSDTRWGIVRDSMNLLTEELEGLEPDMRTYQDLFDRWEDLEIELAQVERDRQRLFEVFTGLQEAAIGRMDSIRFERDTWAEDAFADIGEAFAVRIEDSGLNMAVDTTDVTGGVRIEVSPGDYWVYARYELVSEELYWNLPITVARGEPLVVRLSRENAEVRPVF